MKQMALQESSPSEDQQTLVDGVPLSQAFRLDPVPFLIVLTDKLALMFLSHLRHREIMLLQAVCEK